MAACAEGQDGQDKYTYRTDGSFRGVALIFNIKEFKMNGQGVIDARHYTDKDYSCLVYPLRKLGFEVIDVKNEPGNVHNRMVTHQTILEEIDKVIKADHSRTDCFLCLFLSYGSQNQVFSSDIAFPMQHIQDRLKQCVSLAGKPKLFFLQTCQKELAKTTHDANPDGVEPDHAKTTNIPQEADFFYFWSTLPYSKFPYKMPCGTSSGTIFIQLLAAKLRAYLREAEAAHQGGRPVQDLQLQEFCTQLTGDVRLYLEEKYGEKGQNLLPVVTSNLTKLVQLKPKNDD